MATKMLIVDDSRMSRMMIKTIVKNAHADWDFVEAGSGDEALEKLNGESFDVATIDLNMPGMDGLELASHLREQCPTARMSLLTANIQDSVKQRADNVGIEFIAKPITEDKILGYIEGAA